MRKKKTRNVTTSELAELSNIVKTSRSNQLLPQMMTPQAILYTALEKLLGTTESIDDFEYDLISKLSLLASNGKDNNVFGKDFNDFFTIFIRALNLIARMKQALDDNGIDFNFNDDSENPPFNSKI